MINNNDGIMIFRRSRVEDNKQMEKNNRSIIIMNMSEFFRDLLIT